MRATKQYKSLPYNPALREQAKDVLQNKDDVFLFLQDHPALTGTPPQEGNTHTDEKKLPIYRGVAQKSDGVVTTSKSQITDKR